MKPGRRTAVGKGQKLLIDFSELVCYSKSIEPVTRKLGKQFPRTAADQAGCGAVTLVWNEQKGASHEV